MPWEACCWSSTGDKITAVGTDGRRLAKMEGPCKTVGHCSYDDTTTIVPARSMQLIERAFTDLDAEIRIAVHANDILLKSPRVTIYSRLVEGRFPKWRDVFPKRRESVQIELAVGPAVCGFATGVHCRERREPWHRFRVCGRLAGAQRFHGGNRAVACRNAGGLCWTRADGELGSSLRG